MGVRRVGSITSDAIGPCHLDSADASGACFHQLLLAWRLGLPATFRLCRLCSIRCWGTRRLLTVRIDEQTKRKQDMKVAETDKRI